MVKGDLVRINKNTCGSTDVGCSDLFHEDYPLVKEGELGIYLRDYTKHNYKVIFVFSLQKSLGFYSYEIEPLKKEQ